MAWKIGRGRYGAEALTSGEIQKLQAAPETGAGLIARDWSAHRPGTPQG